MTSWNKGKRATHCRKGHAFTPDNTYITKGGQRQCRTCRCRYAREDNAWLKQRVIDGYGGHCQWSGCTICDPDMLSLDHVNNDGAAEKREIGSKCTKDGRLGGMGNVIYRRALKEGFPSRYQILCANHQIKKEILRRRAACVLL